LSKLALLIFDEGQFVALTQQHLSTKVL
jgi:hypothetical protein